jgi:hypothetical protein
MFKFQGFATETAVRSSGLPSHSVAIDFQPRSRHTMDVTINMSTEDAQKLLERLADFLNSLPVSQADGDGG